MIALAPPAAAKQTCFAIARCIVAHSLDYDAGVLPCSSLLPHAGKVDGAVVRIAAATMDMEPDDLSNDQCLQLQLPARCAGLQLDLPTHMIPLARAARLIEIGRALRSATAS